MKCVLASASWDKTVRLWDMLDSWRTKETLALTSDGKSLLKFLMSEFRSPSCSCDNDCSDYKIALLIAALTSQILLLLKAVTGKDISI